MIGRKAFLSVVSLVTFWGLSSQAWSSELTDEYLLGKWAIQGTDCSDPGSEFVIFRDNGAVEAVRAQELEAAGFWEISNGIVVFQVVTSPAFFHGDREEMSELKTFEGEYYSFRIRVVPFDMEPDQFGSVGILGEQVIKGAFHRCKS